MVTTILLLFLIVAGVIFGLRTFIKGNGSCGDCDCTCPIKEEMHQSSKIK